MVRARGVARKSFARRRIRRVKKYNAHVVPFRYKLWLPRMADLLAPQLDVHVQCETPCMALLASLGVPLSEYPNYLGFMKRLISLYQTFTGSTLMAERISLYTEYELRGKDAIVLAAVDQVAAGCAEVPYVPLPTPTPPVYTPEFYDGFETGDFIKWDFIENVQITNSPIHHGSYAAQTTGAGVWSSLQHNISSPVPKYFVRCFVYFHVDDGVTRALIDVMSLLNFMGTLNIDHDGLGNRILSITDYLGNAYYGTTLVTNGWHCIEFEVNKGVGAILNVWLDGNLEVTITLDNPNEDLILFYLRLGFLWFAETEIDCVIGDVVRPTCTYYPSLGV